MPMKFTVTVTSVGTSSVIVMPKPVLEGFGLKKGDQIDLFVSDNGVYIPLKMRRVGIEDALEELAKDPSRKVKSK